MDWYISQKNFGTAWVSSGQVFDWHEKRKNTDRKKNKVI